MQEVRWLVRIDTEAAAPSVGAGMLISEREVLTCAHVVHGARRATVRLVNRPDHPALSATVVLRGPWPGRPAGGGDVAVLLLDRPVPPEVAGPAVFAPPHRWAWQGAALAAYGFPVGHDSGLSSEVRLTRGGFRIGGEQLQLEHEGTGMPLSPGFSGGPVVIADTGEVVGMVTAAQDTLGIPRSPGDRGRPAVRLGRMLPGEVIAGYVPQLADRLPQLPLPPLAVRELRLLLVGAAPPADPLELYRSAVGPLGCQEPPTRPATLWEACWYLLTETLAPPGRAHPAVAFVSRTAEAAEAAGAIRLGTDLRGWLADWALADDDPAQPPPAAPGSPAAGAPAAGSLAAGSLAAPPAAPAAPGGERWRPILVEISPSGAGRALFHVTVSAVRAGRTVDPHSRAALRLGPGIRRFVRERIDHELGLLETDGAELVVFALPRRLLTEPVHTWARDTDYGPLGADHAVVVVDEQRRADPADRLQLERKWAALRDHRTTRLHALACADPPDHKKLYHQLRPPERPELPAFPGPPRGAPYDRLLAAALKAGAPAVLWARCPCPTEHAPARSCRGEQFLARLAAELVDLGPADLPRRVKELRHRVEESDDPRGHWAADLVLLWEDPQIVPSPARPFRTVPTAPPLRGTDP
ncbi:trypsin-like peptidase domain-containing protein [Kitasatospora sp. NPDC048540]|uniref:VMAP-C domain-containing protein n=1 Tax=unclassified Kitasatospora TaxID=2633591 RepID=UPI00068F1C8D|nr:trypsin-like peptidase domain-containing protein [Kitasatospora sp. MBT63]